MFERDTEIVCLLDEALVGLNFVNQHLHQHLVPGELNVDRLDVLFQAGDLGPILVSLPIVLHLHRLYKVVASALPSEMRHAHRPATLRH